LDVDVISTSEATQRLSRSVFFLWSFFNLQFGEFFQDLAGVLSGFHFRLNVQDLSILAHDESDSVRESFGIQNAIGFGNLRVWIAQNGVVEFQ